MRLILNPRNTDFLYTGLFDKGDDTDSDDAVRHLAKNGITLKWAAHKSVLEFAVANFLFYSIFHFLITWLSYLFF
jgi:hypothetical protein